MTSRTHYLITAQALAQALASPEAPVVLAVRSPDVATDVPFAEWPRIPGALETDLASDFAGPSGGLAGSRPLPDLDHLQSRVRAWGIDQQHEIVVYDHSGGLQAARAWWTLRWAGLSRVRVLDGGYQAWADAGHQANHATRPERHGNAALSGGHLPQIDADQAALWGRNGTLLDTRIAPNYAGGPATSGEPARGHIPGAINVPAARNLDSAGRFLDDRALHRLFTDAGVTPASLVAVYCGAGVSAAHTILALACLGIEAPMYVGSWSAWSADPERPFAQGSSPG